MKKQTPAYVVAGLAMVGLWFFGIFVPYYKSMLDIELRTNEAERQLADFKQTMRSLPGYVEKQQCIEARKTSLNSKLYSKGDVLKLFDRLKRDAMKKDLVVTDITPPLDELLRLNSVIPDSGEPQFLNIELSIEGGYIGFGRFVGAMERANYFRGVNHCLVAGGRDGSHPSRFRLGFKALLGSLRDEA